MTPFQAYTNRIPTLDSLITFGAKITAKKPGKRPTTLNPWTYDGIFLGYQNTMHNIRYWDIHTGTTKTATHDSKDEIQYGDNPKNRSPASKHLMEVFTGSSDHTTKFEPPPVELKLKDDTSIQPTEILESVLDSTPLPYTSAAAATLNHRQKRKLQRKINKFLRKSEFKRPDITHLRHELDTIDISTNTIFKTISHTIPIQEKILHPTLGIISQPHPDIKNRIELTSFQPGTSTFRHI